MDHSKTGETEASEPSDFLLSLCLKVPSTGLVYIRIMLTFHSQ